MTKGTPDSAHLPKAELLLLCREWEEGALLLVRRPMQGLLPAPQRPCGSGTEGTGGPRRSQENPTTHRPPAELSGWPQECPGCPNASHATFEKEDGEGFSSVKMKQSTRESESRASPSSWRRAGPGGQAGEVGPAARSAGLGSESLQPPEARPPPPVQRWGVRNTRGA